MTPGADAAEVVVVGGGPAGAAFAARLSAGGRDVLVAERQPEWRWRACGVFSSPTTMLELRRLGVGPESLAAVARPILRLWVESPGGARFPLSYGWQRDGDPTAVGFDRSALDPLLLSHAESNGARVCRGTAFVGLERAGRGWRVRVRDARGERTISARMVVGADGVGSAVGRAMGVARSSWLPRIGLTYHVRGGAPEPPTALPDEAGHGPKTGSTARRRGWPDAPVDARMVVLPGAYCGLAPVPGGRVNVGIVLASPGRRARLATSGARRTVDDILTASGRENAKPLDGIAGISPIAQRVSRRAGDGWLLVGDAAGFLDPFTGEGLHRALVSARLAAGAADAALNEQADALADYDAAMARRFRAKDLVSWVVQAFVAQPRLFDYAAARLAHRSALRERLAQVMGDLSPASDALDPRFLAALLAP